MGKNVSNFLQQHVAYELRRFAVGTECSGTAQVKSSLADPAVTLLAGLGSSLMG